LPNPDRGKEIKERLPDADTEKTKKKKSTKKTVGKKERKEWGKRRLGGTGETETAQK